MLEGLHEEILSLVGFHEVGWTLLDVLHKEILDIVKFHEVGRNFLEVLHEVLLVVMLHTVGILYLEIISKITRCTAGIGLMSHTFILVLIHLVCLFSFLCTFLLYRIY